MSYRQQIEEWARHSLNAKITGDWGNYKAPCHDDQTASGRIDLKNGWCWCQACEEGAWPDQLAERYSLSPPPLKPDAPQNMEQRVTDELLTEYVYRTEKGQPIHKTVKRIVDGKKRFAQAAWTDNGWDFSSGCLDRVERLLYRLPELTRTDGPVLFVEGEKDVHTAERLGFAATTTPQGAEKADKVANWGALAGREVVILPDNDDTGQRHAEEVQKLLSGVSAQCEILHLPGLPEKGDLSDWAQQGGTKEQLRGMVFGLLRKATPDRQYIERYYLVSAWSNDEHAKVLAGYGLERWHDSACRGCAEAIRELVETEQPIEPITIAAEMRRAGKFETFQELNDFEAVLLLRRKLPENPEQARKAFADLTKWDDLTGLVQKHSRKLGEGCPNRAAAELSEDIGRLLSSSTTSKLKTVRQLCEEYLETAIENKPTKESFSIPLLYDLTGPLGGGDVVPICGPPKAGKSTLLMELARQAARAGISCLVSQLELREEQVAQRELSALSGCNVVDLSEFTARRLQKDLDLTELENISVLTAGNTIDTHKAELWPELASGKYRLWLLDYNERLYEYTVDPNLMAARVAKFVKDTAVMFDVCSIPLLQPNDRYYRDGHNGPNIDHVDYGKKWRKDCQWLGFMHHPHNFDNAQPKEYVELRTMLSRSTSKRQKRLEWMPSQYRFKEWSGPTWRHQTPKQATGTEDLRAKAANDDKYEDVEDFDIDF